MTASKQKYLDIVANMEAAQHELEKAKDLANALTGESYTTGVVTACLSLVSNFTGVLRQMEMFLKDKKASKKDIVFGLRKITDLAYYSARNDYRGAIRDIYDIASELLEKEQDQ